MAMTWLTEISRKLEFPQDDAFPFSLALLQDLDRLAFNKPVTFFVGENGCGKSTLLEMMAAGLGCVSMGSRSLEQDPTLTHARELSRYYRYARSRNPRRRMFLRAEDVFGFTQRVASELDDLNDMTAEFTEQFEDGSYAQKLATGVSMGQRYELANTYGENPDGYSHGETFLHYLDQRIRPQGLYLLDEPETPLSPNNLLALLARLMRWVEEGSQFVIATHSPMLLATPDSEIYQFDEGNIETVAFDDATHVSLTREFLNDPDRYLRWLRDDPDAAEN